MDGSAGGKTIKAYIDRHRSFCRLSIQWHLEILSFRQLCVAAVPYGVTTQRGKKSRAESTCKEATVSSLLCAFYRKPTYAAISIQYQERTNDKLHQHSKLHLRQPLDVCVSQMERFAHSSKSTITCKRVNLELAT
jgi:hypothetical protein